MIDLYEKGSAKFRWWKDWRGDCVAVVAAGPSVKAEHVAKLRNRIHVIAVNESYKLCPWADLLYSCDAEWWAMRRSEINGFAGTKLCFTAPRIDGIKIDVSTITVAKDKRTKEDYVHDFLFDEPGVVGSGGHSGFQAINLAAQFGGTGIALVGFDMNMINGLHWHGKHPSPLRNPDQARLDTWRDDLDKRASQLASAGIDVVNCSAHSSLRAFEKLTIDQTLERWGL